MSSVYCLGGGKSKTDVRLQIDDIAERVWFRNFLLVAMLSKVFFFFSLFSRDVS